MHTMEVSDFSSCLGERVSAEAVQSSRGGWDTVTGRRFGPPDHYTPWGESPDKYIVTSATRRDRNVTIATTATLH